jgi:uncharacterized repeat protein (TIGR03803 family)
MKNIYLKLFAFILVLALSRTAHSQTVLLGACPYGGGGYGSFFSITAGGTSISPVVLLTGSPSAAIPYHAPIKANNGKFYAVTNVGGTSGTGVGTIVEMNPDLSGLTVKVNFVAATTGGNPEGGLVLAPDGNIYGTCSGGGANGGGTIFKYVPGATTVTVLYNFNATNGQTPKSHLLYTSGTELIGATSTGGISNFGVLYRFDYSNNSYSTITSLQNGAGQTPTAGFTKGLNGIWYIPCRTGGANGQGAIMSYNGSGISTVLSFTNSVSSGRYPSGNLLAYSTNIMYGLAPQGGQYGYGCIYEFNTSTNVQTIKYSFQNTTSDGGGPCGGLTLASNGKLYGVTNTGGANNNGIVFEYTPGGTTITKKADFLATTTGSGPNYMSFTAFTPLSATISSTPLQCYNVCSGTATVTPTGGTTPYTYSWAPSGGTGATISGRCAGTYSCTITDAVGTAITKTVTITQPTLLSLTLASQTNLTCNANNTGAATMSAAGGVTPYSYSWAPSGGTSATASNLAAGTYTCTVTDANGCTKTQTVTLTQPTAITSSISSQTNISCNGGSNGAATVSASGGTGSLTYNWAPSGGTTASITGRTAGAYTCTITDANSCVKTQTVTLTQPTVIASGVASQTNVNCFGQATGAATLTVSGGTSPYTYSWAPSGGTAISTTSRPAGTYTCTITDNMGCVKTQTVTITQPAAALNASATQTNVSCFGLATGSATVTPSGGTSPYTYNWTPSGGTAATASGMTATNYTCTVTDNKGCTFPKTVTITQPAAALSSSAPSITPVTCNGGSDGAATVTPTGGTTPYTYSWTPTGGTAATATGLTSGAYTCTITDNNGCTRLQGVSIGQPTSIGVSVTGQTNINCNGASTGAATVTVTGGGSPPYTYNWAPSGGTAATTSNRPAGTYTCTITDNVGCVKTRTVTLTQPTAITSSISSQTNISCNGGNNGAATVLASGGVSPYSYNWTPSGGTAATTTGRTAGTYTCSITDNNGCVKTQTVTLTQPTVLGSSISSQTNVTCNGGNNGAATVLASGGTAPYTYSWTPSGGTAATTTGRTAGTYTCTITDNNGCVKTQTVTLTQPSAVSITFSTSNSTCGASNGSATAIPSGGAGGYTYQWNAAAGNQTTANASGLAAGSYVVVVTDASGCTGNNTASVNNTGAPTLTMGGTNILCFGACNGSASTTPSGGTPPYTYSWAPSGGTGSTASSLCAGTYSVTVTDNNGCAVIGTRNVTQPTQATASFTTVNVSCNGGSNGSATISVSGGTPGYTYNWTPSGGTAATITGRTAGTYTCTVTDANGCVTNHTVTITQPAALSATNSKINVSCNGGTNGTATAIPAGGTATYTYSWAPSGGTAATASGLSAGNYTCTVTDANSCVTTTSLTITAPSALTAGTSQTNVSCNGLNNGSATVTPSGGTAPYSYSWSPAGGTAAAATGLSPAAYTCTITDNNGCFTSRSFTITEPFTLSAGVASQTDVSCNGGSDGFAMISAGGGTPGYMYSWTPSGGTAATASGLSAGNYTCTITDANSCTTTEIVTISQPTAISTSILGTNVLCNGGTTGTAGISVTGGTPAYIYSWAPAGGTSANANGLSAGTYTCTVTDANACTSTNTITITEPSALSAVAVPANALCNGSNDGSATVTPAGGTAGYSYSWSSGGNAATESGLTAGTYTYTVTDANGCTYTANVNVNEPAAISSSITPADASCNGGNDGLASISALGGTPGYVYSWSSGGTSATETGLVAGTYTCTITDINGCVSSNTVAVNEPAAITTSITGTNVLCPGGNTGTATIVASGGTGAFIYNWLPTGGTGTTASGLSAGTYTCNVLDANGCPASDIYIISEPSAFNATINVLTNAGCTGGNNGSAQITVTGGSAPYFYSWTSGGTSDTETGLVANTYTCSFTDNNSCPGSATVAITSNPDADIFGNLTFTGGSIAGGTAYLFRQQSSVNGIDTVASVPIGGGATGSYLFSAAPADNYYIKVILDTAANPTAVPTYYGNTFQWDSSFVATHGCAQTDTFDIAVIELLPSGGPGFISGYIIEGPGYQNLRLFNNGNQPNLPFVPGGPLKGIDVKLGKNPAGGIQARVMTDTNGYYAFHDVPVGDYTIYVDIPNLPMDSLRNVIIGSGTDTSLQNNYYADSLIIYITDTMITPVGIYSSAKVYDNKFSIYPNPTTNLLNLQFIQQEQSDVSIEITNAMGDLVHTRKRQNFGKGEHMISLQAKELNLKAGVYFISILTDNKRYTQRIVVVE